MTNELLHWCWPVCWLHEEDQETVGGQVVQAGFRWDSGLAGIQYLAMKTGGQKTGQSNMTTDFASAGDFRYVSGPG